MAACSLSEKVMRQLRAAGPKARGYSKQTIDDWVCPLG
jgi:hypothetical protein